MTSYRAPDPRPGHRTPAAACPYTCSSYLPQNAGTAIPEGRTSRGRRPHRAATHHSLGEKVIRTTSRRIAGTRAAFPLSSLLGFDDLIARSDGGRGQLVTVRNRTAAARGAPTGPTDRLRQPLRNHLVVPHGQPAPDDIPHPVTGRRSDAGRRAPRRRGAARPRNGCSARRRGVHGREPGPGNPPTDRAVGALGGQIRAGPGWTAPGSRRWRHPPTVVSTARTPRPASRVCGDPGPGLQVRH